LIVVLTALLLFGGVFFLTVSSIGLLRLPDFYSRTHAVGKSETMGTILILAGLAVYNGLEASTLKILVILVFVVIASPTATHAILRAALRSNLEPWTNKSPAGRSRSDTKPEATTRRNAR
jgi:multicomponent Na+:H+ antiporter subunit G